MIKLIVHHSAIPQWLGKQFDLVNYEHKERFKTWDADHKCWSYFKSSLGFYAGYHYFIEKDGEIIQARNLNEMGAHTYNEKTKKGYNHIPGVCLAGNFMSDKPNGQQMAALKDVCGRLGITNISEIYFHRELDQTACPGVNITKYDLGQALFPKDRTKFWKGIRQLLAHGKTSLAMRLLKKV